MMLIIDVNHKKCICSINFKYNYTCVKECDFIDAVSCMFNSNLDKYYNIKKIAQNIKEISIKKV